MNEYMKLVRDTEEMTKRITLKGDIICWVLIGLMALLAIIGIRLIWEEHRERKERRLQETYTGYEYQPTVTDTVQYVNGTEFHRMGVPGKGV